MIAAVGAADRAAEAIRELNHQTLNPTVVTSVDVYEALGALSTLLGRMPQALDQLDRAVNYRCVADQLRADDGHAGLHATVIGSALADARAHLADAWAAIDGAHQAASHIWFDHEGDD